MGARAAAPKPKLLLTNYSQLLISEVEVLTVSRHILVQQLLCWYTQSYLPSFLDGITAKLFENGAKFLEGVRIRNETIQEYRSFTSAEELITTAWGVWDSDPTPNHCDRDRERGKYQGRQFILGLSGRFWPLSGRVQLERSDPSCKTKVKRSNIYRASIPITEFLKRWPSFYEF